MNSWMTYEVVNARHQDRLREAAHNNLARAVQRAQQEPSPLMRAAGGLLAAAGDRLTAVGRRLQAEPPVMAWPCAEEPRPERAGSRFDA